MTSIQIITRFQNKSGINTVRLLAVLLSGYAASSAICAASGLLIAQQAEIGDNQAVTRLVYDSEGGTCVVDESKLPTLTFCEGVFDLFGTLAAAGKFEIIEEPLFLPDGPPRRRWVFEPVTLTPNQQFFGVVGWFVPETDVRWPEGISEEDVRTRIAADYEVEIDGVAFKGTNIAIRGPVSFEAGPGVTAFLTYFDYAQIIRTPGRHSVNYRFNLTETLGECPDCLEPGIWSNEFTIDIVPEGDPAGMAAQAPAPFSDAVDMGDGWWASEWFGTFQDQPDDWILHGEHGPLLVPTSGTAEGFWAFDLDLGWWFSGSDFYPFLYSDEREAFLFYARDSVDPRNFFDLETEEWITDQ